MIKVASKYMWLGMALSSMFFYPLSSSLNDSPYYMHWKPMHSLEFLTIWLLLSIGGASVLWYSQRTSKTRVGLLLLSAVVSLPMLSFFIQLIRQLRLNRIPEYFPKDVFFTIVAFLCFLLLVCILHPSLKKIKSILRQTTLVTLLVISPITLLTILTHTRTAFISYSAKIDTEKSPVNRGSHYQNKGLSDFYIFLFDEMSYEYLFHNGDVMDDFPRIKKFTETASIYHNARSPGNASLNAILSIFSGQKMETKVVGRKIFRINGNKELLPIKNGENSFVRKLLEMGYSIYATGCYLQYDVILEGVKSKSTSFSLYNYSSANPEFSLLNPIYTNLILWPDQNPFGYIKKSIYSHHYKNTVDGTTKNVLLGLSEPGPVFHFVHYCIPHVPFIYDKNGFNPAKEPLLENDENYIRQMKYVDKLFGILIDEIASTGKYINATIILMSDHNYRKMFKGRETYRIPFIVKNPKQKSRADFFEDVEVLSLLSQLP